MTEHTKGRLHVEIGDAAHYRIGERVLILPVANDDQNQSLAPMAKLSDFDNHRADARRLAACWNALEDWDTAQLEAIKAGAFTGQLAKLTKIEMECSELIEALESVLAFCEPDSVKDQVSDFRLRTEAQRSQEYARALLAKHAQKVTV
jgi:hypothetical protein